MDKIEYIKLEITIPKITYQLIKNKMYLPVDEDIICKAVRNGIECKSVLDKIRAEIEETYMNITYQENKDRKATWGLRKALEIIDKYKVESEET